MIYLEGTRHSTERFYHLCKVITTSNSQRQFYWETYFYLMVGGDCLVGLVAGALGQLAVDLNGCRK